jgi:hypothetical protein
MRAPPWPLDSLPIAARRAPELPQRGRALTLFRNGEEVKRYAALSNSPPPFRKRSGPELPPEQPSDDGAEECARRHWRRRRRPRHLRQKKEAVAAPPPSESKWRELRPRTPFSDPFQRSGATVANIPHYGDWSSQAVNQQKGDGSSGGSTANVRLDARAPMRRELVRPSGRVGSRFGGSPPPYCRRRCFDGASPVSQ